MLVCQLMDLAIDLAGIRLNNPVIAASGTFGYGEEFERFADLRRIGAISIKGTSARPIDGNLPPRLFPTASGMLNSIGLENVGVDALIQDKMPFLRNAGCAVFVNVFGFNEDEYLEVIDKLNACEGIAAYELNISCPNTKDGGRRRVFSCRRSRRTSGHRELLRSESATAYPDRTGEIFKGKGIAIGTRPDRADEAMNRRVIIALDVSSREEALHLLKQLRDLVGMFKVGSQLFMTAGPSIVQEIIGNGGNVFLDLKFHDIPNTVT